MAGKTLVAVFSASGVTKRVGEEIARVSGGDFFEIIPFCTSGGSGVGRSDTALHRNVSGDVKWAKGVQINRPDEAAIKRMLENVQ